MFGLRARRGRSVLVSGILSSVVSASARRQRSFCFVAILMRTDTINHPHPVANVTLGTLSTRCLVMDSFGVPFTRSPFYRAIPEVLRMLLALIIAIQ